MTRDGKVVTRQADHGILKGITRTVVIEAIAAQGLKLEERAFTLDEAHAAREAFITSASQIVLPVVKIDGRPVGNGAPGPDRLGAAARLSSSTPKHLIGADIDVKLPRKHTNLCKCAANLGLRTRNGVPSNIDAPSLMADHHAAGDL